MSERTNKTIGTNKPEILLGSQIPKDFWYFWVVESVKLLSFLRKPHCDKTVYLNKLNKKTGFGNFPYIFRLRGRRPTTSLKSSWNLKKEQVIFLLNEIEVEQLDARLLNGRMDGLF